MEVGSLRNPRRIRIRLLPLLICLLIAVAFAPFVSAKNLYRKEIQYIVEGTYSTIEGDVVDNETGDPVGDAEIVIEVDSGAINLHARTDADGHFKVIITENGDHDFVLSTSAVGYDPSTVTGSVKFGEIKYLRIQIQYNPFDLQLSETSGSLSRGYAANSYSGRYSVPFLAQRTVQVVDAGGNPVYDIVEERTQTIYTWEERIIRYRVEQITVQVPTLVPQYRTERYVRWVTSRVGPRVISTPVISTRQVFTGYKLVYTQQITIRNLPYETWVTRTSTTPPDFYNVIWGKPDNVRNMRVTYITTFKKVPRVRVETYTAYRTYEYGGTYYSFQSWGTKQVTVTATPRNGYNGSVRLVVVTGDGVEATLGSSELRFASPATTTLRMTPRHASIHIVTVRASDSNGRLVRTVTYQLNTTESLPSSATWERYVGTTTKPDFIPETKTSNSSYTEDLGTLGPLPAGETFRSRGPVYDGGTFGGPLTQFWTVDYLQPTRPDGTLNYLNQTAWDMTYGWTNIPNLYDPSR